MLRLLFYFYFLQIHSQLNVSLTNVIWTQRFRFYWKPLGGFYFHWWGLKKCFLQFKTLRRVIYIPLEGFRYISWGFIIPLEGFRNLSRGFIHPLEGFRYPSYGFIIQLEGFRYLSRGVYKSTGEIQKSFQRV